MKTNILIVGPFPEPVNGCSLANAVLRRQLRSHGLDVDTVDTAARSISSVQGKKFSLLKAFRFFRTYFYLWKILRTRVVYITPGQTFFGVLKYGPFIIVSRLFGRPVIFHLHGNFLGKYLATLGGWRKAVMSYLIRSCTAGIVLSRSMKENFNFLIPPENVHVVSNFSEDIFFKVDVKEKNTDILRLCYLSNVMRDKGIFILLDALAILDNKGVDYCCKIAGAVEKDLELEFADRVDRFGPKVQYIGSVSGDHKHSLLMNSNVMVLPTFYEMEGQPISLLEGLASGNIIVSTDHSGIPDVVNRDNGFLVKTQDSNGLAFVLEKIAANIATEVNRFSQHNQCYAKENFSETRFGERISLIISNVEAR